MKRTILIDGDIIAYQIAASEQKAVHWGGDFWSVWADAGPAKVAVEDRIESLKETLEADEAIVAISDPDENFRKDIFHKYKSNRDDKAKPFLLPVLKEWMLEEFKSFMRPKLEADDVLGILATSKNIVKGEKIIVSMDKDLDTVPGLHFNFGKPEFGIYLVSEEEAALKHMTQTLTGDTTDGYPGCPGIGPVKAERLLDGLTSYKEMWPVVVGAFEKAKLSEEEALVQAQIARICHASDYNFKKKEVKPWRPPK